MAEESLQISEEFLVNKMHSLFSDKKTLISPGEIAKILRISNYQVSRMIGKREFPSLPVGESNPRVIKKDFIEYLLQCRK